MLRNPSNSLDEMQWVGCYPRPPRPPRTLLGPVLGPSLQAGCTLVFVGLAVELLEKAPPASLLPWRLSLSLSLFSVSPLLACRLSPPLPPPSLSLLSARRCECDPLSGLRTPSPQALPSKKPAKDPKKL